jgi:hypothetical protein
VKTGLCMRLDEMTGDQSMTIRSSSQGMLDSFRGLKSRHQRWLAERWPYFATNLRLIRLDSSQPARYSIISTRRASTVGLWFAGINGAALVLDFAFFIQAYLSFKSDCATGSFAADAMYGARVCIVAHTLSGAFALVAAWLPSWTGSCRDYRRRRHDPQQPPLGHEFEGWSEKSGYDVVGYQWVCLIVSILCFALPVYLVFVVAPNWSVFEQTCSKGVTT